MPNKVIANFQPGIVTANFLGKCRDSLGSWLDLFKPPIMRQLLDSMLNFFHAMNSKVLAAVINFSSAHSLFSVLSLLVVMSFPLIVCPIPVSPYSLCPVPLPPWLIWLSMYL